MKRKVKEFIVYAPHLKPSWTLWNTLNLGIVLQRTKREAMIRFSDIGDKFKNIKAFKITIEEITELPKKKKGGK